MQVLVFVSIQAQTWVPLLLSHSHLSKWGGGPTGGLPVGVPLINPLQEGNKRITANFGPQMLCCSQNQGFKNIRWPSCLIQTLNAEQGPCNDGWARSCIWPYPKSGKIPAKLAAVTSTFHLKGAIAPRLGKNCQKGVQQSGILLIVQCEWRNLCPIEYVREVLVLIRSGLQPAANSIFQLGPFILRTCQSCERKTLVTMVNRDIATC